ncbi:PREDICTED: uncharacterized protein LOC104587955 [Nelumbo nucifera]|uniref:Uncharacterized protein LOC104587955 n=1 Tax=Nelumbo nucifera TaxID=4432 RepID=A0A1U7Z0J3_NELNU|nr:PREDICTED: uncharacterized protein LOC104587955 [Nelumbo nucifera]
MKVDGTLDEERIVALIDSGNTHNFLSPHLSERVGLSPSGRRRFEVSIANGQKLVSLGKCTAFDHCSQNPCGKCQFGQTEVKYLGHIISQKGVVVDPKKVAAIVEWARPNSLKSMRGILGLTDYYQKFV